MASPAYDLALGYQIGSDLRQRAASEKVTTGLTEYQKAIEGGAGGALPIDEDPSAKLARLQQAEDKFYSGLREMGFADMEGVTTAMTTLSTLKGTYVAEQGTSALGMWETPEAPAALERAFEAANPGSDVRVKETTKDADGNTVYVMEFPDPEGGESEFRAIDQETAQEFVVGLSEGPAGIMAMDKRAREINQQWADELRAQSEEQRDEEAHAAALAESEAGLGYTAAATEAQKASATSAYALAASRGGGGDKDRNAAAKMVQSTQLSDDLLDFEKSDQFRSIDPGGFETVFQGAYLELKSAKGVAPTRREVLDEMERSIPEEALAQR